MVTVKSGCGGGSISKGSSTALTNLQCSGSCEEKLAASVELSKTPGTLPYEERTWQFFCCLCHYLIFVSYQRSSVIILISGPVLVSDRWGVSLSPYWWMEKSKGCPSKGDSEELAVSLWFLTLEVVGLNTIKEFCNNSQDMEATQVPCPSTDKWIMYTMEHHSAIKKNEILPFTAVRMGLESVYACCNKRKTNTVWCHLPAGSDGKESTCNAGDLGLIPGLERPLKEGVATHSTILAWRIPVDREAWLPTVHGVTKSQIWLSD